MVKADPTRNYYADLELPVDASSDDIKRAYKKLALKFHPDRNSGREVEVVPKFQAIQAAFEILNDPAQKTKYDNDRRKMGAFATGYKPNVPPRNPYTTATKDFSKYPPPPRRTEPRNPYDWTNAGNRSSASAARPRQQQQPPPPPPPQQPQTNADRFARFPKAPTAQKPSAKDDAEARYQHFSAWQRMGGGKPRSSQDNEFAKAQAHAQAHAQTHSQAHAQAQAQAQSQAQAQPQAQSPYGYYAPTSGAPGIRRSQTTRTPRKAGFDPTAAGADEPQAGGTSAYYTNTRYNARPFPNRMSSEMPPGATASSGDDDVPFTEGNARASAPYHNLGGERMDFGADVKRSSSTRNSPSRPDSSGFPGFPAYKTDNSHRPHRSASPGHRRPFSDSPNNAPNTTGKPTQAKQGGNATRPFFRMYDSSEEEDVASPSKESRHRPSNSTGKRPGMTNGGTKDPSYANQRSQSSIFNMNVPGNTFKTNPPDMKSRSEEHINTTFSPDGWRGKFEGNPDYFAAPPTERRSSRSKGSPVRGRTPVRPSPGAHQPTTMPPPPPPPPRPPLDTTNVQSDRQNPVKFSPAEWQSTFKEASFAYQPSANPPSPTKQQPPRQVRTPKSRQNSSIPANGPKPATVSDVQDDTTGNAESNASSETLSSADSSAMDIDIEIPAKANDNANADTGKGARKVSTAPSRPEWRDPHGANGASTQATANSSAKADPASFGLKSLKNVAPFTASKGGVDQLSDLNSTLPFTSKASKTHPSQAEANGQTEMPRPPKPPAEPSRLTRTGVTDYMARMMVYETEWNKFNSAMLNRFTTRQAWVNSLADSFTGNHGWIGALGDTKEGGFQAYMDSMRDDVRSREHWNTACERHVAAMEKLAILRDRVEKGGDMATV